MTKKERKKGISEMKVKLRELPDDDRFIQCQGSGFFKPECKRQARYCIQWQLDIMPSPSFWYYCAIHCSDWMQRYKEEEIK